MEPSSRRFALSFSFKVTVQSMGIYNQKQVAKLGDATVQSTVLALTGRYDWMIPGSNWVDVTKPFGTCPYLLNFGQINPAATCIKIFNFYCGE